MELIRLNKITHIEEAGYTDFDSLAWNERYQEHGDFQMITYDIEGAHRFIQLGDLVSVPDSETFAIVEDFSYDLDESGTLTLTVSGTTATVIFDFRPSLAQFAATTSPDRFIEEFGDPLETNKEHFQTPSTVLGKFLSIIDGSLVRDRTGTEHLKLPFNYSAMPASQTIHEERVPSFEVDEGAPAWGVINDLMNLGRFHFSIIRPGSASYSGALEGIARLHKQVTGETLRASEHLQLIKQYPSVGTMFFPEYKAKDIVFSAAYDDYQSANNNMTINVDNVRFRAYEDGVLSSTIGYGTPQGLDARLTWEEVNIGKASQWEWDKELTFGFTHSFATDHVLATTYSLGTNGLYPYRKKVFSTLPGEGRYHLGDVVRLEFPWGTGYDVIVEEFVRTADSSGYMEYPTFKHFVTTDNFMGEKPTISSMPYHTSNSSLEDHKDWL